MSPRFDNLRAETTAIKRALRSEGIFARVQHGKGPDTASLLVRLGFVVGGDEFDAEHEAKRQRVIEIVKQVTGRGDERLYVFYM